ncbi:MAG: 50S ribosomal protein L38e [Vulcanisaeta sp. AZ3]
MPREVFLVELWRRYADTAEEIRVKRYPDYVKLKARLKHHLYTIRVPSDVAEQLIREYKSKNKKVTEYS